MSASWQAAWYALAPASRSSWLPVLRCRAWYPAAKFASRKALICRLEDPSFAAAAKSDTAESKPKPATPSDASATSIIPLLLRMRAVRGAAGSACRSARV